MTTSRKAVPTGTKTGTSKRGVTTATFQDLLTQDVDLLEYLEASKPVELRFLFPPELAAPILREAVAMSRETGATTKTCRGALLLSAILVKAHELS